MGSPLKTFSTQTTTQEHSKMSRYPSAYGHTPSYKTVGSGYPSALSSSSLDTSYTSSSMRDMDREMNNMKREMDRDFGSLAPRTSTSLSSPLNQSSSYQSKSYSASSSSNDGGRPHYSSQSDSVYKSTRTGTGNIPHTSYSHNTSSYDSDRPYRNNVSSFSYNI